MSEVAVARPFPPFRLLFVIVLWSLFGIWMVCAVVGDLSPGEVSSPALAFRGYPSYPLVWLTLDIWALAATLVVGFVGFNPLRWLNGKRLVIGSMAFALMLGRLFAGLTIRLLELIPIQLPQWIVAILVPFDLFIAGIVVIGVIFAVVGAVFAFFVAIPVMLFNQILAFDRAIHVYRYQAGGLASYIVRAVYWLRNEPMPKPALDERRGARFATREEVAAIHNATRGMPARMAFGHWPGATDTPFFVATDKHVLVMASTRSGKGVALIIPHLLRYQGSAFVLDPKGENAKATGRQRAKLNGKVHYLDPFGISGKPQSRYNPLSRFTPENMEAESKALAAAIFVVEGRERNHWTDSGQQLLATIILYVFVSPEVPREQKDLPTVRTILLGALDKALKEMVELEDADGLLRDLAISFLKTPEKEFGSIVSSAQRQTEILDNPFMKACLAASGSTPEVNFADWHRGTMTVYLCLAAPKFPTFNRWLRLVLTSALDTMTERLDPPALPVCFMLDELATLGRLETVENAVGLSAGYGIQLVTVFQDVAQMRGLYNKRWSSFVGNAGVRALFNLDDHETAEYWSNFMGGQLVETHTRQEDLYGLSKGQNVGETMRPLISSDRLMMDFAAGKMLVLVQGARPIVSDRVPYYGDGTLASLWDDPRRPVQTTAKASSVPPSGPAAPPSNGAGSQPNSPPPPRSPDRDAAAVPPGSRPSASRPSQPNPPSRPFNAAGIKPGAVNFTIPGFKPYPGNGTKPPPPKGPKGRDAR